MKTNKIWIGIQFEGPADPEELYSCIDEALCLIKKHGMAFATTANDEPITIETWNPEWVAEGE